MTTGDPVKVKIAPKFAPYIADKVGEIIEVAELETTYYIARVCGSDYAFTADEIEPEHMTTAAVS